MYILWLNGKAVGGNKARGEAYIASCDIAIAQMLDAQWPTPTHHKKG